MSWQRPEEYGKNGVYILVSWRCFEGHIRPLWGMVIVERKPLGTQKKVQKEWRSAL